MYRRSEPVVLQRDCPGTEIPGGDKVLLRQGSQVTVIQSLGGSYTVMTDEGYMVRIDGKDADVLGSQYVKAQAELEPADPEGPSMIRRSRSTSSTSGWSTSASRNRCPRAATASRCR